MRIKIRKIDILILVFNTLQYCVYILGIILFGWIINKIGYDIGYGNWPPSLAKIADASQIIIGYAAIFAIGQYAVTSLDREDRKTKTVLEFIKFFRETVIRSADEIRQYSKKRNFQIPEILIRKNTKFLKFSEKDFFGKISQNQKDMLENYINIIKNDWEFEAQIRSSLNAIEEFSIGILNTNSQDHRAVESIKKPFLEIVEMSAVPLYYYIGVMADKFPYLSDLYDYWKKDIGFLPRTKEDRLERYEERKREYREKN